MFNKPRLLTPGPTPLPESVRLALARDMIHHRKSDFQQIMENVQRKLQLLFGCKTPVLPLAATGTGAMTAAVYSLFKPGDTILVVEAGKFGERWSEIAKSRALNIEKIILDWGKAVTPEDIDRALIKNPQIRGVLIQICETSTAVLQPVKDIAAITQKHNVLLVADGISAVGISPCPMSAWGIDCLLTGSQKGLMLPPGLALLALSDKAWEIASSITPGCYYFNLPHERTSLEKNQTAFTSAINLIYGLEASLDLLLKDGLESVYRKQWALTMLTRSGARALGLNLLAASHFAWGVTSILMPDDIDSQKVLRIAQEEYGVYMAGGQDRLKGRIVRLGHMGWVDWSDCLAGLYALAQALDAAGNFTPGENYLEEAMHAYNEALKIPLSEIMGI